MRETRSCVRINISLTLKMLSFDLQLNLWKIMFDFQYLFIHHVTPSNCFCGQFNASKHLLSNSSSVFKFLHFSNCLYLRWLTGFITDGNSKLVGNARLRQVRVHKDSCRVADFMQQPGQDCHAPYSWELEDMGSYGPGWSPTVDDNSSQSLHSPWTYRSQGKLKTFPIWGSLMLYRGGGFVVALEPDFQNSSR